MGIEVVKELPLLTDSERLQESPLAVRYLNILLGTHNTMILLKSNTYAYNPTLSYRAKLGLTARVMFSSWDSLVGLGFKDIADCVMNLSPTKTK